ncbi:hypothetical protein D7Y13_06840 [Corallococcus praedator]|uniref:Uncharacterized protein n=1 Tax=Corallococcus praedator TaxID=2316724 RepID=A0ABX9QNZ9_9BACT|nr:MULTISPECIES: hypothetical protein [Corallococcus]RKH20050.1 hypothetical protein D7X74_05050 [Corallococcus sp. CA047B]RKH35826.1 hypothetical protein D7X75_02835 [Corallococcus sp. CA031C]RKI13988.1 hypothetical protein D7Y13_06840 [Corallococcus praedator]
MLWRGLQAAVNQSLSQVSGGQASLDNLDALPADWEFARPYCEEAEFFEDYLVKLAGLEVYFRQNDHLGTPFPAEVWSTWIELYASPNVLHFPGLPNNTLTDMLLAGRDYRLEILEVVLPGDDNAVKAACAENARILGASLTGP